MDYKDHNADDNAFNGNSDENNFADAESGTQGTEGIASSAISAAGMQSGPIVLQPDAQGVIVLPAGVSLSDIRVEGRDLVITLPDGQTMIIPDGAVIVPELVLDGVAIPPANLIALLIGEEPEPEAGDPQSSGGNFATDEGAIQDPFAIGDLLPPTALAFPERE
ncbi:hypothetical protein, partial [Sphingorhabdus sp. Alg239-R122]|uniref:hypothetical protein n=1 Tax=Sphingorhabdus sp. Alg239-R122 TaxID=2305989 RepID=UPI0013DD22F4